MIILIHGLTLDNPRRIEPPHKTANQSSFAHTDRAANEYDLPSTSERGAPVALESIQFGNTTDELRQGAGDVLVGQFFASWRSRPMPPPLVQL
jgi:hypothetical protein